MRRLWSCTGTPARPRWTGMFVRPGASVQGWFEIRRQRTPDQGGFSLPDLSMQGTGKLRWSIGPVFRCSPRILDHARPQAGVRGDSYGGPGSGRVGCAECGIRRPACHRPCPGQRDLGPDGIGEPHACPTRPAAAGRDVPARRPRVRSGGSVRRFRRGQRNVDTAGQSAGDAPGGAGARLSGGVMPTLASAQLADRRCPGTTAVNAGRPDHSTVSAGKCRSPVCMPCCVARNWICYKYGMLIGAASVPTAAPGSTVSVRPSVRVSQRIPVWVPSP